MSQPVSKLELIAYADGELPPARAAVVEALLRSQPGLREEVESLRRLNEAARAALADVCPSEGLRQSVEQLLIEAESDAPALPAAVSIDPRRWWQSPRLSLAAGIIVLLGTGVFVSLPDSSSSEADGELLITLAGGQPPRGLSKAFIRTSVQKHVTCEQMADHFYDKRFPRELAKLPAAAAEFLADDPIVPDLSSLGYEFAGAGGCIIPGGKTIHLLYREPSGDRRGISVFVQRYNGQIGFEAGSVQLIAGPSSRHHMFAWRTDSLVYFVIGDEVEDARATVGQMGQNLQG